MNTIKDFILLIPCYNNLTGLIKSVNSAYYSPEKFEILIVDDGSEVPITHESLKINKPGISIQLIRLEKNQGIVNALNTGLKILKDRTDYKYIARLDAGDTCHPERFIKQVEFLDAHTDIFLLGTWCRFENPETGKGYDYITKTKHNDIIKEMHYKCSFIHPTVMFKKEVINTVGFYPTDYPHAEDYAFFWRIIISYKTTIFNQILVTTILNKGISIKYRNQQISSKIQVIRQYSISNHNKLLSILRLNLIRILPYFFAIKLKQFFYHKN